MIEDRKPFLPLSKNKAEMSIEREFMIEYIDGTLWVKSPDGKRIIELGRYSSIIEVDNIIKTILGTTPESDTDTLKKIAMKIAPLEKWKDLYMEDDIDGLINTILDIVNKFEGYSDTDETLKQLLDSKVDIVDGKRLSSNNFTLLLKNKLENIEDNANNYTHPPVKQCNYVAPVLSVNKKTGDVVINKYDLGLQNLDPNANDYEHPIEKVCTNKYVKSVNGRTGTVIIDKAELGLSNVINKPTTKNVGVLDWDDGYMTTDKFKSMIDSIYFYISTNFRYVDTVPNFCTASDLLKIHDMDSDLFPKIIPSTENLYFYRYELQGVNYLICAKCLCVGVSFNSLKERNIDNGKGRIIEVGGKYYRSVRPSLKLLETDSVADRFVIQPYYYCFTDTKYTTTHATFGYDEGWGSAGVISSDTDSGFGYIGNEVRHMPSWRPMLIEI